MIRTLKDINWNQVYCFHEVARRLSMKKASQILGVSTPTVSEQIKRLEEILGISLFIRRPRQLELSKEGKALYHCTKEMFEAGVRFLDTVAFNSIGGYSVRVGIQETISASVPINFVSRYWDLFAQYGTVNTIRAPSADDVFNHVNNGTFDWALTLEKPKHRKVEWAEVDSFEVAFCCSSHLYEKFLDPKDILRTIPLARSSWDHLLNETVDDHLHSHQIFPEEIIETDHLEFCIGLAQRGRCVAIFAKKTLDSAVWGEGLKVFSIGEPIRLRLYAVWLAANERMISIKKLKELLGSHRHSVRSEDPDFQLKINQVPESLLKPIKDEDD